MRLPLSRILFIILISTVTIFNSCKKNTPTPEIDPYAIDKSQTYLSNNYENNLRDSIWYYYKILSLWQDVIPPTNTAELTKLDELGYIRNNYTQYFNTGDDVLEYLKSLTKNRYPNRTPESNYDWYSFLDRGGSVSSGIQENATSGLGMSVFYLQSETSGTNADLYIKYIETNSSAFDAGLQRGDQIISINNDTKLDYDYQKSMDFVPLNGYLNSNSITIKVRKANGNIDEKTLRYKNFTSSPILASKVIPLKSKKVGYFLFNSFASIRYRGSITSFYTDIQNAFSNFEQQGISDLIIDLRYNGGGDVETAEYFANLIAPAKESGKLMYSYTVNNTIKEWGWLNEGDEFAPIKFQKSGSLNINSIYFLVSPNTASASELLINSLKPVMPTYLIGTYSVNDNNVTVADKTYGKPVGFFGLPVVNDNLELYVTSFKMYNRSGEGDYFDGLTTHNNVWEFQNFEDFGNENESMLASALNHIETGSFKSTSLKATLKSNSTKISSKEIPNTKSSNIKSGMFKFKKQK